MPNNQVQLRRDTAANIDASTPALGEPAYDTTNKRLRLGDGATSGGTILPNATDIQNLAMIGADAGGSANALTVTLAPAPSAYTAYMLIAFKATATNTSSATINVNSLGLKTLKRNVGGTKQNLSSGDLVLGRYYLGIYDGTDVVIINSHGMGRYEAENSSLATGDQTYTFTHGLGVEPWQVQAFLECTTADLNYSIGDKIEIAGQLKVSSSNTWAGLDAQFDSTAIDVIQERDIYLPDKSSGAPTVIDYSDWKLVVRAEV